MSTEEIIHHYQSPSVGWLEIRVTGKGVRSIEFVDAPGRPMDNAGHPVVKALISELEAYFSGKPMRFTVALDPGVGTPFQRRVWEELCRIPRGETRSYRQIAEAVGVPKAARAVGSANHANPLPIVVPCHRVITADGGLGGYGAGIHIKEVLLQLEGATHSEARSTHDRKSA
jgi:methylated-DNA-[protein]-cysteine S-methyltransferase